MKKTATKIEKKNAAEIVSARLIEIIESTGRLPWERPWLNQASAGAARNFASGKAYNGVNALLLSAVQAATGYSSPYWLTFKQAVEKKGSVKKGSHGTPIVYFNVISIEDRETGDEKNIPLLKYSTVFNLDQIDGIEAPTVEAAPVRTFDPIEEAERIIAAMPLPQVNYGGNRCYYSPNLDYIQMSKKDTFQNPAAFYATFFHEAGHSSGSASKLARKGVTDPIKFGSDTYGVEELIVEIASSAICLDCNILDQVEKNSAAYLKSWVKAIKGDSNLIIRAASQAQKAYNFLLNIKPEATEATPEPEQMKEAA